ncbi:formate dehydrogenase accessory protein FdhE [Desulfocurvibacter africanus]|uniref:Formate dehydrogenase accessory protein n=1 Tax=Desulfocurvibacter africanus subsp. africanus str. Walvis Bay TaxID=690850 RepID=F3Z289_DESAF|nr:formate dehydrogenase accessory protein FdhE [Desulfocurvibacter africanus]EGJ50129.1 formate dehydrogenase accessory protein [Desulfocurvibacter africanus subsp. africanus str. Walvis Bay]
MAFDYDTEKRRLERKLAAVEKKGFLPKELLDMVGRTARLQLEAQREVRVEVPTDLGDAMRAALGAPLLPRAEFACDREQALRLFGELLSVTADAGGALADASAMVRKAVEEDALDPAEALSRFLAGDDAFFQEWGQKTPGAPRLLSFLAQASLTPSLRATAEAVADRAKLNVARNNGHCPICGSLPFIGSLREKEGYRYLSCSFCHSDYRAKRLACAYCGEDNQQHLEYFESADEPGYRVELCHSCKRYVKTADFRNYDRLCVPGLDDLESLALDIRAVEEGYSRPTLSAWGF